MPVDDYEFMDKTELKTECRDLDGRLADAQNETGFLRAELKILEGELNKRLDAELEAITRLANVRRIMVERLWFPRFIGSIDGKQRWSVFSWMQCCDLRSTTAVWISGADESLFTAEDPIEALEKCAAWWKENVK